jgi:Protein of unknown function (DUF3500)
VDTARDVTARETAAREAAARMAAAAADWLDSLEEAQRAVATGSAPSPDAEADGERRRWFYTPTDHSGLTLGAQRPAQQRLAHRLIATGLSTPGYVTVAAVIGLDNVLDQMEGWSVDWGRERGRDPGLYRAGAAAVLPAAGPAAADRVRQRAAAREPCALGVAGPGVRFRLRRARGAPGGAPHLGHHL